MSVKRLKDKLLKLINIKDNPYKLAKSMALGFFLALLPLPGLNIPLGVILAKLLRLNIVATTVPALLLTYVSPFLYVLNYKTGAIFIKTSERPPQDFTYDLSFWEKIVNFFSHAGPAYLLGSAINATLAAATAYVVFLYIYKNAGQLIKNKKIKLVRFPKGQGIRLALAHLKKPYPFLKSLRKKKVPIDKDNKIY